MNYIMLKSERDSVFHHLYSKWRLVIEYLYGKSGKSFSVHFL